MSLYYQYDARRFYSIVLLFMYTEHLNVQCQYVAVVLVYSIYTSYLFAL